jgi:hypothetical protein
VDTTGRKGYEKVLIALAVWMFETVVCMTVPLFITSAENLHVLISVLFMQLNTDKRPSQRPIILFFTTKVNFRHENNFVFGEI